MRPSLCSSSSSWMRQLALQLTVVRLMQSATCCRLKWPISNQLPNWHNKLYLRVIYKVNNKDQRALLVPVTCVAPQRLGNVSPASLMEPGSFWVGGVGTGDNWGFVQGCRVAPWGRKINVWFLALERRKQDAVDLLQPVQSVNVFFLSDAAVT